MASSTKAIEDVHAKWDKLEIEDKEAETMLKVLDIYDKDTTIGKFNKDTVVNYATKLKELKEQLNDFKIQLDSGDITATEREYEQKKTSYEKYKKELPRILQTTLAKQLLEAKQRLLDENEQQVEQVDIVDSFSDKKTEQIAKLELLSQKTKDKKLQTTLENILQNPYGLDKIGKVIVERAKLRSFSEETADMEERKILERILEYPEYSYSGDIGQIYKIITKREQTNLLWNDIQDKEVKTILEVLELRVENLKKVSENLRKIIDYAREFEPLHKRIVKAEKLNKTTYAEEFEILTQKNYETEKVAINKLLKSLEPNESTILRQLQYAAVVNQYKKFEEAKITYTKAKQSIDWFEKNKEKEFTKRVMTSVFNNPSFKIWMKRKIARTAKMLEQAEEDIQNADNDIVTKAVELEAAKERLKKAQKKAEAKLDQGLTEEQKYEATKIELQEIRSAERGATEEAQKAKLELNYREQQAINAGKIIKNMGSEFYNFKKFIEHEADILQTKLEGIDKLEDIRLIKHGINEYIESVKKFKDLLKLDDRGANEIVNFINRTPFPENVSRYEPPSGEASGWASMRAKTRRAAAMEIATKAAAAKEAKEKAAVARAAFDEKFAKVKAAPGPSTFTGIDPDHQELNKFFQKKAMARIKNSNLPRDKESIVHILKNGFNRDSVTNKNWRAQYLSLLILMYARDGDNEITITEKPKVEPIEDSDKVFKHWAHCATEGDGLETDLKNGNTIDRARLERAKQDIVTTIKTILLDDPLTPTPISGEPYLVLQKVAGRIKEISKNNIDDAEATKLAKWAISEDGINTIDVEIEKEQPTHLINEVPALSAAAPVGDETSIETHNDAALSAAAPVGDETSIETSTETHNDDYGREYGINDFGGGTRKKLRKKQPRRKQSRRKQSTRKQPRRKQPGRKQSTRKQPRRKQPRRKQLRRK